MNPSEAPPLRRLTRADVEAIMAAGPPPYDFSNADLSDEDLRGLPGSFANANFTGSNLSSTLLEDENLAFAQLRGTNLRQADLRDASFAGADLTGARLESARCMNVNFNYAILRNADLSQAAAQNSTYNFADFQGANLFKTCLKGSRFFDTHFEGADLRGADLEASDFTGATFDNAQLGGVNLYNTILPPENMQLRFIQLVSRVQMEQAWAMLDAGQIDPGAYGNAAAIAAFHWGEWRLVEQLLDHAQFRATSAEGAVLRAIRIGDPEGVRENLKSSRVMNTDSATIFAVKHSRFALLARLVGASADNWIPLREKLTEIAGARKDTDLLAAIIRRNPYLNRELLVETLQNDHYAVVDFLLTYENRPAVELLQNQAFMERLVLGDQDTFEQYVAGQAPEWQAGIDGARLLRSLDLQVPAEALMHIATSALREGLTIEELRNLHLKGELVPILAKHFGTEKVTFAEAYSEAFGLAKVAQRIDLGLPFDVGGMHTAVVSGLPQQAALDACEIAQGMAKHDGKRNDLIERGTSLWTQSIAQRAVRDAAMAVRRIHEVVRRAEEQERRKETHAREVELRHANFYLNSLPEVYRDTEPAAEGRLHWSIEDREAARNTLRESALAMRHALERFVQTVIGRNEVEITDAQVALAGASAKYQDVLDKYLEPIESAKRIALLGTVQAVCKTRAVILTLSTCEPLNDAIAEQRRSERLRAINKRSMEHGL